MLIRRAIVADALGIALVHAETWRTTYRGIVPDAILDNLDYVRQRGYWEKTLTADAEEKYVLVAEDDGGRIVGFASSGPNRETGTEYDSELYGLYILREHQLRGLGQAMFINVARWLCSRQHRSMIVWVLEQNPARRFYESLGGVVVRTKKIQIGIPLDEISYGWPDLQAFVDTHKNDALLI